MGYYINPPDDGDKIAYIVAHGARELPFPPLSFSTIRPHMALLCAIDNGDFWAVACCCDKAAFELFANPLRGARRPRRWFVIDRAALEALHPSAVQA